MDLTFVEFTFDVCFNILLLRKIHVHTLFCDIITQDTVHPLILLIYF